MTEPGNAGLDDQENLAATSEPDIWSEIEVAWDDQLSIVVLTVGGHAGQVYLDPDEARAIGQALIRAAEAPRVGASGPDALGSLTVHKSVRFSTRSIKRPVWVLDDDGGEPAAIRHSCEHQASNFTPCRVCGV